MKESVKMSRYALFGVLGGISFMVGDCLLYCYLGFSNADIDPLWVDVAEWRFVLSAWMGFLGMALMLPGFYAFNKMIENTCGKLLKVLSMLMLIGIASSGFLHFALGSLLPITYKTVLMAGGSEELGFAVANHWRSVLLPLDIVLLAFLALEYIVHFAATASGKLGLSRFMCLVGPVGAVIVGILWSAVFRGTAAAGAWGACESMGEALVFLTAYLYWKRKTAARDRAER